MVVKLMPKKAQILRFGEKLRQLRKGKGLTLNDLAERLGYTTHGYISEIENSKKSPTVEFVLSVSRLFDISTDLLLKDELEIPHEE